MKQLWSVLARAVARFKHAVQWFTFSSVSRLGRRAIGLGVVLNKDNSWLRSLSAYFPSVWSTCCTEYGRMVHWARWSERYHSAPLKKCSWISSQAGFTSTLELTHIAVHTRYRWKGHLLWNANRFEFPIYFYFHSRVYRHNYHIFTKILINIYLKGEYSGFYVDLKNISVISWRVYSLLAPSPTWGRFYTFITLVNRTSNCKPIHISQRIPRVAEKFWAYQLRVAAHP